MLETAMFCKRCNTNVVWPKELSTEAKTNIATTTRRSKISAAKLAVSLGLTLEQAKALSFHITANKGQCHRCHRPLGQEASVCANCQSVNLDW